nr:hypothetical protein [Limnospira indica]
MFQGLPYFDQRASNGLLWVDYLASEFGLNPTTLIDPDSPIDGVNFAFNGATTGDFNATQDFYQVYQLNYRHLLPLY